MIRLALFYGLPNGHDISMEVVRIVEYRHALLYQGLPRMAEHVYGGYGAPVFVFYAPLFLFLSSIFSLFLSLEMAIKVSLIFLSVCGAVGTYYWMRAHFHQRTSLYVAALFSFSHYKWVDLFTRNAFAEYAALMFLPAVFGVIAHCLIKGKVRTIDRILFVLVTFLFLLSHNISVVIAAPFLIVYMGYLLWRYNAWRRLFQVVAMGVVSLALTSFFWLPAFFEKSLVQVSELLTGKFFYASNFIDIPTAFVDMTSLYYISPILLIVAVASLWKGGKRRELSLLFLLLSSLAFLLMTEVSRPIWDTLSLVQFAQFPWRFMVVFSVLILVPIARFIEFLKRKDWLIAAIIVAIALPSFVLYMKEDSSHTYYPENITVEKIEGENLRLTVGDEYLPQPTAIPPQGGIAGNSQSVRTPGFISKIYESKVSIYMPGTYSLPFNYFPYLKVYVDKEEVPTVGTSSGELGFYVDKGVYIVEVYLSMTALQATGVAVSILMCICIGGYSLYWLLRSYFHNRSA